MGNNLEASKIENTPENEVSENTKTELNNLKSDIEVKQQEKAFKEFKDIFSGNVLRITKLSNISGKEVDRLKKYFDNHHTDDEIKAIYKVMGDIFHAIYERRNDYKGKDRKVFYAIYDYLKQKYDSNPDNRGIAIHPVKSETYASGEPTSQGYSTIDNTVTDEVPDNTAVTDEVPDNTAVTDEVPDNTAVTDEVPDNTAVTDEVPDNTAVTDEVPDNTAVTDEVPDNTEVTDEVLDNTEVNSLKDQLLAKENMTGKDKENMSICIDMILNSAQLAINKEYTNDMSKENLLKGLSNNVKYGQNYIEIGGIKYGREPIIKDEDGNPKLITGDEYTQALNQQKKEGITIKDIETSCSSLPASIMLGVLLGIYFDGVPNLQDSDGNDIALKENGVRSFLIGTTDKDNEGKILGYYMQTQEVLANDEEDSDIAREPQIGPMGSIAISSFNTNAKFFGFYKS